MSSAQRLTITLLASSVVLLAAGSKAYGAAIVDPAYRFRTIQTDHFVIYFHQKEERLAERLSTLAEEVWRNIETRFGLSMPQKTHVVLVDQTELANGLATPLPYNTIVITAAWPGGSEFIGKTDDWLRLVFTHEFTHVVHLDRSVGWAKVVRGIFGRVPLAFPNLFLPKWQIEGLATYEESVRTDGGRLHAGDFRAIVDEAAVSKMLEPLDRVNGGLTDWPGGTATYAYGVGFHDYLAKRFGEESFGRLATATAGRVPFTASPIFRKEFGESLGALWRDYERSLTNQASSDEARLGTSTGNQKARRLTHHGFEINGPRFDKSPCVGCPADITYSVRTPEEFPALYRLSSNGWPPQRLANRYLGSTSAIGDEAIYFDQQELRRNVGLYSDLYALNRKTGRVTRLTSEARLLDPDLGPDGRTLVAVQDAQPGQRNLVLVDLLDLSVTTVSSEPETQFNTPRWSPDGRAIAVERHIPGRQSEIAIVDVATRDVRTIASRTGTRFVTPTWRPDGRAIVAAADASEGPFELYEIPVDSVGGQPSYRRLTRTTGGATWPDISADGQRIVYVGYTTDGFDLFEMPYPSASVDLGFPVNESQVSEPSSAEVRQRSASQGEPTSTHAYNPFATLAPTSWWPILGGNRDELRLGLETSGTDVLGYHGYTISGTWLTTTPSGFALPASAKPEWQISYQYSRWRPTLWFSASSETSFFAGPANESGVPSRTTARERVLEGGVVFPVQHIRTSQTTLFSIARSLDEFTSPGGTLLRDRTALRGGWSFNSSKVYGYSISQEDGTALGITTEFAPQALGSSADTTATTVDWRLYLPAFARHHVLAIRFAGGRSTGDPTVRRTFHLGGAQSNLSTTDFGRDAISLMRGFGSDTFAGSRVALLNAEYRWPLMRPQRGYGTWPIFLHTLHAAGFADVGHAWDRQFEAKDLKTSIGAELSLRAVVGYSLPLTGTVGGAWGRDGSGIVQSGVSWYARFGWSF
jgi:WD40-like Beta Propeller Repeat